MIWYDSEKHTLESSSQEFSFLFGSFLKNPALQLPKIGTQLGIIGPFKKQNGKEEFRRQTVPNRHLSVQIGAEQRVWVSCAFNHAKFA